MESDRIYEESKEELGRISKLLGTDTLTINLFKLDGKTKQDMITAISNVIYERRRRIDDVIMGAK